MQDTGNENACPLLAIKHNMHPTLDSTETRSDLIAPSTKRWPVGKHLAAFLKVSQVTDRLIDSPLDQRVVANGKQITLSPLRKTKTSHRLTFQRRDLERLTNTIKNIAVCGSAGITVIDRRLHRGEFRFEFTLIPLQCPKRRPDNLAGILILSALNLRENEAIKLLGQIHVASGHKHHFIRTGKAC